MIIVELKQKGKSENYVVRFDNNFSYILSLETIVKNKLNTGSEVEEDAYADIIINDQKITGFEKAITLLTKTFKTEKQVRQYLKEKLYHKDAIENIIQKLKEYKYLNDEEYAKSFISTYKESKGKLWIKQQLFSKGINKHIISKHINEMDTQQESIEKLVDKFLKGKEKDQKTKEKLLRNLLSKGFTYEEVKSIVNNKFKTQDDWE